MKKAVKQTRPAELVYGVHPIVELLKAKRRKLFEIYTLKQEPKVWRQIEPLLPAYKVPVHHLTREQLSQRAGTTDHQGIAALVAPFPFRKTFFNPQKERQLLMLDGVQDVRNFGAIIRSAYCTGVDGIIVIKKDGAPLSGAALKASAGLAERMELYVAASAAQAVQLLKEAGYHLYVTALGSHQSATEIPYTLPLCAVIGSEDKGVSREVLKEGTVITLAQKTHDVSYNASVAAGIVLFIIAQAVSTQKNKNS